MHGLEQSALVIADTTPPEAAVCQDGLEGGDDPIADGIDGLHVVMAVDEGRRLPRCREPLSVDYRLGPRVQLLHILHGKGEKKLQPPTEPILTTFQALFKIGLVLLLVDF